MADEPSPCQELVELVTDPFENALGPADRARFEAHVDEFSECDIYLSRMQPTLKLVGATAGLETGPDVSALLDAFRDWRRSGA